jgi:hypothetical protein
MLIMTAAVKAMDSPRWFCRIHLFQFNGTSFEDEPEASRHRLSSRLRLPVGRFNAELLGVLRGQPLPTVELHGLATSDAADGSSAEKAIQNIESNVPARGAPRDEAAIDAVPEREARAATKGFEFPPRIVVLKHLWSVGSRHSCFERCGRSHPGELHRSNRTQVPIGLKGRPLAQMHRVGKRLPDFFRRVTQFSDENERPLLSVLSYLRPAGRTRCVLLAIDHLLLLSFFVRVD